MPNSVEPQISTVEDPPEPEPEIVSKAAERTPKKAAPVAAEKIPEKAAPAAAKRDKKEESIMSYPMPWKRKRVKNFPHPPYFQMISEALEALKEKTGSSPYAIAKHMEEKHKDNLPYDFKKTMTLTLKKSVANGKLIKIKASYKLAKSGKPVKTTSTAKKSPVNAKTKAPKPKLKAAEAKPKAVNAKTKAAKAKPMAAEAKPKATEAAKRKPKMIKSPAKKKAKKASA